MIKLAVYIILFSSVNLSFASESNLKLRGVGQPPLVYEYNIKGPVNLESDIIATPGTIKTIHAFWQFEGEVSLEASANGGVSYTKIVCGLPLNDGFIPGNKLRFRIKIPKDSILRKLIVGYIDNSGATLAFYDPRLILAKFSKQIYISGANQELFNYPVKVEIRKDLLGNKKVEMDLKHVCFTAADGQTPLAYYLEEKIASPQACNDYGNAITNWTKESETTSSVFWVKIPQLPKEGLTIHLYYYSDKDAVFVSNPEAVFLFFDDFNNIMLDKEKWRVLPELKPELIVKEGVLSLRNGSIISRKFNMVEGILEFKARAEANAAIQGIIRSDAGDSPFAIEEAVYSSVFPGAEHAIAVNDVAKLNIGSPIKSGTDYIFKVTLNSKGLIFERYNNNYQKEAEVRFLDTYVLKQSYIGLKAPGDTFSGGRVYFDWIRARPYTEIEPKATCLD